LDNFIPFITLSTAGKALSYINLTGAGLLPSSNSPPINNSYQNVFKSRKVTTHSSIHDSALSADQRSSTIISRLKLKLGEQSQLEHFIFSKRLSHVIILLALTRVLILIEIPSIFFWPQKTLPISFFEFSSRLSHHLPRPTE
ncbi:hypothetical protein KCU85_g8706, partial [Aureobasidium melanogenum]